MDSSKPDPLAKGQMENLQLSWEQQDDDDCDGEDDEIIMPLQQQHDSSGDPLRWSLCGTLTLSSEYISIAIHAMFKCKTNNTNAGGEDKDICNCASSMGQKSTNNEEPNDGKDLQDERFENELYIKLTVTANFKSVSEPTNSTKEGKLDRKERATKRKLRTGIIKRLRSNPLIRRLLIDEEDDERTKKEQTKTIKHNTKKGEGIPLCEALIQQNQNLSTIGSCTRANGELEERVNSHEDSLEGIRNAIFSHSEDSLDVLQILLHMPYFPRSSGGCTTTASAESPSQYAMKLNTLADRAYLRLLEDAMFDACEKEGEDELLDDLNISDANYDDDDHDAIDQNEDEVTDRSKGMRKNVQSKRVKPC